MVDPKNIQQMLDEGSVNLEHIYRAYEEGSDIPLVFNKEKECFENLQHNRILPNGRFSELYLMPNTKRESLPEEETTFELTEAHLSDLKIAKKYSHYTGINIILIPLMGIKSAKIPIKKAKEWGLI